MAFRKIKTKEKLSGKQLDSSLEKKHQDILLLGK
jgi:hypothetical protein